MDIDVPALRWAKAENLERLLRSLGAPLPERAIDAGIYHRRLVRAAWLAMDHDKRQAAAEEQRMKDEAEALRVAMTIASTLGENGARQIAQIKRIVTLMGAQWTRDVLAEAEQHRGFETIGHNFRKDGVSRTFGGSFFATAKAYGSAALANGTITRRQFFRAFTSRLPKSRPDVVRPVPKGKECVKQLSAGPNCFRAAPSKREASQRRIAAPEVMIARRKVG